MNRPTELPSAKSIAAAPLLVSGHTRALKHDAIIGHREIDVCRVDFRGRQIEEVFIAHNEISPDDSCGASSPVGSTSPRRFDHITLHFVRPIPRQYDPGLSARPAVRYIIVRCGQNLRLRPALMMNVRSAHSVDTAALAQLWYDGWQDAHAQILPVELARIRTLDGFERRLTAALEDVRMVGPSQSPLGFYMLKGDELYQLYVSAPVRGAGVAASLIEDAEARLAQRGVEVAWLSCAIGNQRAARFYEKHRWIRAGSVVSPLETDEGVFNLEVWRYEKRLASV